MKIRLCAAFIVRLPSNDLVLLGVLRLGTWIRCYVTLCLLRVNLWNLRVYILSLKRSSFWWIWLQPSELVSFRTKGLARRSSALFVSPRVPLRAISKNAMLFFLLDVIIGAGAADLVSESSVRAHSIRGVATSVAFLRNWSVSKVLEAATWRSNSVFASFYLKDVSYLFEGLQYLGNFMATG